MGQGVFVKPGPDGGEYAVGKDMHMGINYLGEVARKGFTFLIVKCWKIPVSTLAVFP